MTRRIIHFELWTSSPSADNPVIFALCDDGTLWRRTYMLTTTQPGGWEPVEEIPQPPSSTGSLQDYAAKLDAPHPFNYAGGRKHACATCGLGIAHEIHRPPPASPEGTK